MKGIREVIDVLEHYGPGPHKSGSDQSVHGGGGGGNDSPEDVANALGFDSVDAMNKHQAWLKGQKKRGKAISKAVKKWQKAGGLLDIRKA